MRNKTTRLNDNKTTRFVVLLLMILFWSSSLNANSQQPTANDENPLWMRYNSISPKGDKIAFAYKGDIWTIYTTLN